MSVVQFLSSPKSFEEIASEIQPFVQKFRRSGSRKATFRCPAHEDKTPSAWIAQDDKGWTHAHCSVCGNLRQTFNDMGVFFSRSEGKSHPIHKERDRSREYFDTLRKQSVELKPWPRRQLEVLFFGEPESTLTYDVYPVDGHLLEKRLEHARQHPPKESPFAAPYTAEGIEKTRALVRKYLTEHRHLTGPFPDLLFSHTSLDPNLSQEKREILHRDVKGVLITPLRHPRHHKERAWQETWLDAKGQKICRHFPAGVEQKGRVWYRRTPGARTLIVGEGLESTLSIPDKNLFHRSLTPTLPAPLTFHRVRPTTQACNQQCSGCTHPAKKPEPKNSGPVDRIAAMTLTNFAHLELAKKYDRIILAPDLEWHGKGLQAVLQLATKWLPQLGKTKLYLMRPDGKGPHDPITEKKDCNDLTPEERARLVPIRLTPMVLLPDDHPMRQWSEKTADTLATEVRNALEADLNTPGTGKRTIYAVGTGVGKSHALAEVAATATESVLVCAPTREGRHQLAEGMDEHHSRAEVIDDPFAELVSQELKEPEHYCHYYYARTPEGAKVPRDLLQSKGLDCTADGTPIHMATEPDQQPVIEILSILGHSASQHCTNVCDRGLATLYEITNGKKGQNTGAPLCPHMMERLECWYQTAHLSSTHAALNGDPLLFKVSSHLRSKIVVDEAPKLVDDFTYSTETFHQVRLGIHYNLIADQKFYVEADRDDRLDAYQELMPWIVHIDQMLLIGWKNGHIPPPAGKDWSEFHALVEKWKYVSYITIFERGYRIPGDLRKHRGPILLDRLSRAIKNDTLFWHEQKAIVMDRSRIGEAIMSKSRKQDIIITTATPSRALSSMVSTVHAAYPATSNLHINWIRGRNWSATALTRNKKETLRDLGDILEAASPHTAVLTTKKYQDAIDTNLYRHLLFGHWHLDHEGHNRWKDITHLEILGLQMLPQHQYWMLYEATRRLYNLDWQPAHEDDPWETQMVGVSYLPGSAATVTLPKDNADFTYFIREYHTIEVVQAIGRLRAARRLDTQLTVNLRTNMPLLPSFGLVIESFEGHHNRQQKVHNRAVEHVSELVQRAIDLGLRPTFRQIDAMAKADTGKGIRYTNWKQVVDGVLERSTSLEVNTSPECAIAIEQLWLLRSQEALEALARERGDKIRRREAAIPGRGDSPDGEALQDVVRYMDRHRCNSGQAATALLTDLDKNRHHPGDGYAEMLREIILKPIPDYYWQEEAAYA